MNPPPESALDGDVQAVLTIGTALFLVGLALCLRGTRIGRQIAQPSMRFWRNHLAMLRLKIPGTTPSVRFDGVKMIGAGLMGCGYVAMGAALLFVAPGWGALGFAAVAAISLARAR